MTGGGGVTTDEPRLNDEAAHLEATCRLRIVMGSFVKCLADTLRFLGGKMDLRGLVVVVVVLLLLLLPRVGAEDVRDNFARTVLALVVARAVVDFVGVNAGGLQSNTEGFIVIVIMIVIILLSRQRMQTMQRRNDNDDDSFVEKWERRFL